MYSLELSVHVRTADRAVAEAKGYKGASTDIDYQTVPRVGEYFTVHPGLNPLKITRVTHWGPGFESEAWAEIHFSASLEDIEKLLSSNKKQVAEEWGPMEL